MIQYIVERVDNLGNKNSFYNFAKYACLPICKVLYPFKFANKNTVPNDGAYIIACNHLSASDAILIALGQERNMNFMAKSELFKNKLVARLLTKFGAFAVNRNSGDGIAINRSAELLNNGELVTIFLEGTRSRTGELLRPRSGVALVAYQSNVPVIPAAITLKNGGKNKIFKKRTVRFGEPLTPTELGLVTGSPKEFRDASRKIMDKIKEMREIDI